MPGPHGHHGGGGGRHGGGRGGWRGGGWGWGPGWGAYPWWPEVYYEPVVLVESGQSVLPDASLRVAPIQSILGRRNIL